MFCEYYSFLNERKRVWCVKVRKYYGDSFIGKLWKSWKIKLVVLEVLRKDYIMYDVYSFLIFELEFFKSDDDDFVGFDEVVS